MHHGNIQYIFRTTTFSSIFRLFSTETEHSAATRHVPYYYYYYYLKYNDLSDTITRTVAGALNKNTPTVCVYSVCILFHTA